MSLIEVKAVSKIYRVSDEVETVALDQVTFSVEKGEFLAIVGPSGSGKSTLMHILGALDVPTSGSYRLDDQEVGDLDEDTLAEIRNQKIGFVFQAYNLLPRTSALKNVMMPMIYGGIKVKEREKRAKQLLSQVGLADKLNHWPNMLSGGQQQRVAIARALAMTPAIILADEPTGNISGQQVTEIMDRLNQLNQAGHTLLIITHDQEVAGYAKRTLTLKDSRLVADNVNGRQR
ncbi:macrolide ABC transporter ATP-binding protein [Microgenomates group bacterium RBG_16_45_19]|nr:MAG: macrolide ABC transporter ATP-binding protein [Microgenomates group bacterium RBG_16_45_19]